MELNSTIAGESESKTRVPQRSDCASDSLINGWSINISAPSPALTIHADPKNITPAPDFTIQKGEGGASRRRGYPEMVSKKDSKIIRDLAPLNLASPSGTLATFPRTHDGLEATCRVTCRVPQHPHFGALCCKCTSYVFWSLISTRSTLTVAPRRWPGEGYSCHLSKKHYNHCLA